MYIHILFIYKTYKYIYIYTIYRYIHHATGASINGSPGCMGGGSPVSARGLGLLPQVRNSLSLSLSLYISLLSLNLSLSLSLSLSISLYLSLSLSLSHFVFMTKRQHDSGGVGHVGRYARSAGNRSPNNLFIIIIIIIFFFIIIFIFIFIFQC